MGAGRSGSTILGIALGNCANVFYAGELNLWPVKEGKSPLPGAERARFWEDVRANVSADLSGHEARSLQKSVDLLRVGSWRTQHRLRRRYRRFAEELYRAIARASGVTHIVDSSHFPRRARELQRLDGIDLYLLFLVRNPENIVASYSGDDIVFPRFNTVNTNVYLWFTYLLSLLVFLRHPRDRRLLVRYEAFVANPEGVLQRILDCIDSHGGDPGPRGSEHRHGVSRKSSAQIRCCSPEEPAAEANAGFAPHGIARIFPGRRSSPSWNVPRRSPRRAWITR